MTLQEINNYFRIGTEYTWNLYFFTINRKANNPYKVYKIKMKDVNMITNYANNLLTCVEKYQLAKITEIENYDGQNTNLSCAKISTDNDLIKSNWTNLISNVFEPTTKEIKNKIKGYIVEGQPKDDNSKSFALFKVANPVFNVNDNKSIVFKKDNDELDPFSDDLYKLSLTVDFFVIGKDLYTFNYKFEEIFDIEKTLQKLKTDSINDILNLNCFSGEEFKEYLSSYAHPKTFITLSQERMDRMKNVYERKRIADILRIKINQNNEFENLTNEQSLRLIKYLCYKILKDGESGSLFEVSQAVKLNINES